ASRRRRLSDAVAVAAGANASAAPSPRNVRRVSALLSRLVGAVAGALAPEGQRADEPGDRERDRALVRALRVGVDIRHRILGLALQDALADEQGEPPHGGVTAVEDPHEATLPLHRDEANEKRGPRLLRLRRGPLGRVPGSCGRAVSGRDEGTST